MAERRMFAKSIIDSDKFLDMPLTTQMLYFHLSMRADDDGFVSNPKRIERMVGCSDDDLKLLIAKQFIIPFESGIIVIKHWKIHNYIRSDRYKPSNLPEKAFITIDENSVYQMNGIPSENQAVYQMDTQVRLGKDRIGKVRLEGDKEPNGSSHTTLKKPAVTRHKYGEYGHVKLTDEQYSKLIANFGEQKTSEYIKRCDEYCQQYGKSYKDYNLTIRKWISKDGQTQPDVRKKYDDLLEVL